MSFFSTCYVCRFQHGDALKIADKIENGVSMGDYHLLLKDEVKEWLKENTKHRSFELLNSVQTEVIVYFEDHNEGLMFELKWR